MSKSIVQSIGVILVGLLALYGSVSVFTNATRALGAANGAAFAASQNAPAQQVTTDNTVPPYLNYQGTLRNTEGQPISGIHKLTFRIYDDVTDPMPEALWMEEHNEVTVRNGQFSVLLGNSTPLSPAIFHSPDRFVGITLDTLDEMVPRQRFASAPFAMYADHATDLIAPNGGGAPVVQVDEAGRVGVGTTNPQAQLQISSSASISTALQVDGDFRTSNGNVLLAQDGGRVGIGTNNPLVSLHISGQDPDIALDIPSASPSNQAELRFGVDGTARAALYYDKTTNDTVIANANGALVIDDQGQNAVNGNLRVNGTLHATGDFLLGPNARKPVLIHRFNFLPTDQDTFDTGISANEYQCTTGSWSTGPYDISEDSRDADMVWVYIGDNSNWQIHVKFMSDDEPDETPHVDVLCFLNGLVQYAEEWEGSRWIRGE